MKIPARNFPEAVAARRTSGRDYFTTPWPATVIDAAHIEGGGVMVAYTNDYGTRWSRVYQDAELIEVYPIDPVLDAVRDAKLAVNARENISDRNRAFFTGLIEDIYQAYWAAQ